MQAWEARTMKVRRVRESGGLSALQMTPMIDIVFQLLVFFIMTFKIILPEGDFQFKFPPEGDGRQASSSEVQAPPIYVRLHASQSGDLAAVTLNDQPIASLRDLRARLIALVGEDRGPNSLAASAEVEFDCDYHLKYRHAMQAISAVSGYRTADKQVVKLIENIKFAPLKRSG